MPSLGNNNNYNTKNNNRLPRLNNGMEEGLSVVGSNHSGNPRSILGIVGNNSNNNGARLDLIENSAKIKEISRAYKVNLDPLNDLKDRYR